MQKRKEQIPKHQEVLPKIPATTPPIYKKLENNKTSFSLNSLIHKFHFRAKKKYLLPLIPFIIFIFAFYFFIIKDLPSPQNLGKYEIPQTTKIVDRHGKPLYEIFTGENRTLVKLKDIPKHLRLATLSIEDKDFYKHQGINPIGGMLRAVSQIVLKQQLQGGSTITQQLIKSALLTPERTITRKVKEIILAFWAERLYS